MVTPRVKEPVMQTDEDREFSFLLDKIQRNRNLDLSGYRRPVLERRIQHRLYQARCDNYWDYIMLLNKEPEEYDRLIEALTIKVSAFFRDPKVFLLLSNMIVPEIISRKQAGTAREIRAWSCGSAFGQEAYSLAMLFYEALGRELNGFDIQIIATDIDKKSLEEAQWGSYDGKALNRINPLLVFKYFTRVGDRYVVNDMLRSLVTFRYHDVVSDNTMAGMDLVMCRNLLIYFQKELGNIVTGAYIQVLAEGLGVTTKYSIPAFAYDMLGAVLDETVASLSSETEQAVVMESEFFIRNEMYRGFLIFVLTPVAVKILIKALAA